MGRDDIKSLYYPSQISHLCVVTCLGNMQDGLADGYVVRDAGAAEKRIVRGIEKKGRT